jgi:hypothetical protein
MASERRDTDGNGEQPGSARPRFQFGVLDLLLTMVLTALALGMYKTSREWLPLIVVLFIYYVTRRSRWRGDAMLQSTGLSTGRRRVGLLKRVGSAFLGTIHGAILGFLVFAGLAIGTGINARFIFPVIIGGGIVGLLLGAVFPRLFSASSL